MQTIGPAARHRDRRGEAMLAIADAVHLAVGIDSAAGMIRTAQANLLASQAGNVRFLPMEAERLEFPGGFFDVISNRHCPFSAPETARVLKEGGVYLTQQVGEEDKYNLKMAFGRGQSYGIKGGTHRSRYTEELQAAGFREVRAFAYNAAAYYETAEDLIFLLRHTPIIPHFGENEADFAILEKFVQENRTDQGIRTNEERFMIIARK
ncbi:class I SAM-dependent methyltransferase [Paenibacillus sp. P25]|nr:class I SAM-dependent methyltransferase [Paenibacillus sp. P25]